MEYFGFLFQRAHDPEISPTCAIARHLKNAQQRGPDTRLPRYKLRHIVAAQLMYPRGTQESAHCCRTWVR